MDIANVLSIEEYIQLVPVLLIGLLAGGLNYFNNTDGTSTIKRALMVVCTSGFICTCVFTMLSSTQLPYMAKVGISASVGYFGIDRAIEVVQKILNLRK
ncbi:phage holin family protein [Helicobacter heilmannii]|uniref:phage holin family protein n=1 Tax=Helicobacter heilmannii TaxID=35817 RepID=UPI000CF1733D|nr:phage holin family protein [Helicobacter heilmannii]